MKKLIVMMAFAILAGSLVFAAYDYSASADAGTSAGANADSSASGSDLVNQELQVAARAGANVNVSAGAGAAKVVVTSASGVSVEVDTSAAGGAKIKAGNVEVRAPGLEVSVEGNKVQVKLSNGENAEVKVMPSTASETALARLRLKVCTSENNCTIELKQVGSDSEAKVAYEVRAEKKAKVLGLFSTKMQVRAQVDAETGDVRVGKPWWAFLASEPAE